MLCHISFSRAYGDKGKRKGQVEHVSRKGYFEKQIIKSIVISYSYLNDAHVY